MAERAPQLPQLGVERVKEIVVVSSMCNNCHMQVWVMLYSLYECAFRMDYDPHFVWKDECRNMKLTRTICVCFGFNNLCLCGNEHGKCVYRDSRCTVTVNTGWTVNCECNVNKYNCRRLRQSKPRLPVWSFSCFSVHILYSCVWVLQPCTCYKCSHIFLSIQCSNSLHQQPLTATVCIKSWKSSTMTVQWNGW